MGNGRICIRSVSRWIGIGIGCLENFCGAQVRGMLLLELMEGCVSNSGNALSHSFLFNLLKAGTLSYCCIHPFLWSGTDNFSARIVKKLLLMNCRPPRRSRSVLGSGACCMRNLASPPCPRSQNTAVTFCKITRLSNTNIINIGSVDSFNI